MAVGKEKALKELFWRRPLLGQAESNGQTTRPWSWCVSVMSLSEGVMMYV